jgi:TPR repeat protein
MRYKNKTESISLIVRCEIRCRDIIKASPDMPAKMLACQRSLTKYSHADIIDEFYLARIIAVLGFSHFSRGNQNTAAPQTQNDLRKAADQGNAPAQIRLGFMYAKGEGVAQDYVEAAKWYRKFSYAIGVEIQSFS